MDTGVRVKDNIGQKKGRVPTVHVVTGLSTIECVGGECMDSDRFEMVKYRKKRKRSISALV